MRALRLIFGLALPLAFACGDGGDSDGVPDAAARDAGAPDSGVAGPSVPCGPARCDGASEYCREDAVAPCVAPAAGECGDGEEACRVDALTSGCTPTIPRRCVELPAGDASCVRLIDSAPCGPGVAVTCSGTAQLGLTLRCPPP